MKTKIQISVSLFYFLFLLFPAKGQGVYEWGPVHQITDSATFNSNPSSWWISYNEELAILYEKKVCDTCNSDIWFRNLTTMEPETPVLVGNEMHSTPLFIPAKTIDFRGFIIYLSNITGDTNIFATKLENDFSVSETTQLTFTSAVKHNMTLSKHNYKQHLGWIEDSCAWTALPLQEDGQISLHETTKLDSIANTALIIGNNNAYFQRQAGDSLHIYGRNYVYNHGLARWYWDDTYPVKTSGNNTDLSVDKSELSGGEELIWVMNNQVHGFNYYYEFILNTCNLPNIQHPSHIMWDILVKDEWMPHVLVYATGEGDNTDIYGSFSQYGNSPDTTNLTNDGVLNSNPDLFFGEYSGNNGFWIYAVWQTHRNGHIALYYSKFLGYIEGGVDEHDAAGLTLSATPNPFSQSVQININTKSNNDIQITIYSLAGKSVFNKRIQLENTEISSIDWQPHQNLPRGMYLVVAEQDGTHVSQRVIFK